MNNSGYIYWLPYFDFFKIPLFYFDIAIYDKYLLAFEIIPIIFITMVFFSFIQYAEKKCKITLKLGLVKSFILMSLIISGSMILQSILVLKTSLPTFFKIDIWEYIAWATLLVFLKYLCSLILSKIKFRITSFSIILGVLLVLILSGVMIYIHGYNANVIDNLYGQLKTIDNNKIVLFETLDKYYIVPCEEVENNSIKIYTNMYEFIDKDEQLVQRSYYNDIYNEYGIKLN